MTREDRFLDLFGRIDDKFVIAAMPRAYDVAPGTTVSRAGNTIEPVEITERDIRRYRILQAVRYTAAAAVVIAAGALLWANWDKIAVSGGGNHPAVTAQSEGLPGAAPQGTSETIVSPEPPVSAITTDTTPADTTPTENAADTAPTEAETDTTPTETETDTTPANANDFSDFFSSTGEEPTELDISGELTFNIEQREDKLLCSWAINGGSFLEQAEIKAYAMLYSEDGINFSELKTYEPDTDKCGWSLSETEERPVYFMLQCIFTYEDKPYLGYSDKITIE